MSGSSLDINHLLDEVCSSIFRFKNRRSFDTFRAEKDTLFQVLVVIFSHLPVDDVKSCRLVCQKWRFCCEHPAITDTEKFVFRRVYSIKEINNFLLNLSRPRVNVEFVNIELHKLDFRRFGAKIKKLRITNCDIDHEKMLKNLFVLTPNMKHLDFRLDESFDFSNLRKTPKKVMAALERDNFRNRNLEIFEYYASKHTPRHKTAFSISRLEAIFPRIRSIRLMEIDIMYPFLENSISELYNCFIDFDRVDRKETFASVPKLVDIRFKFIHFSLRCS